MSNYSLTTRIPIVDLSPFAVQHSLLVVAVVLATIVGVAALRRALPAGAVGVAPVAVDRLT